MVELGPNERSILAYFPSSETAMAAKEALLSAGYPVVQVDQVSKYGYNADDEINNPISGGAISETGLTAYSGDAMADNDARVLIGADPSSSGMSNLNYGVAGGHAFMVTVVTQNSHIDQAVQILESHEGLV